MVSRLALAMGVSRLATISGPAAQEEARMRALHRAQLLVASKEKTAGIPEASLLWGELEAIEQVNVAFPPAPRSSGPGLDPDRTFPLFTGGRQCHE